MESTMNDSFTSAEAVENFVEEETKCDGVLDLEGLLIPVESSLFDETLVSFHNIAHHYQDVPAWIFIVLFAVGVSGNVVNVWVFSRPFMRTPINFFLCTVEFVNIFVFVTFLPDLIRYYYPDAAFSLAQIIVDVGLPTFETAVVCCSNWLTVAIGIWRYGSLRWPLKARKWWSLTTAKLTIVAIVFISIAVSLPGAFLSSIEFVEFNVTYKSGTPDSFTAIKRIYMSRPSPYSCENANLANVMNWLMLLTTGVPCCCLALVTILLLRSVWSVKAGRDIPAISQHSKNKKDEEDRTREKRITLFLALLLFLFLLAYLPDTALNFMVLFKESVGESLFYRIIRTRIFILICNCLTFFIYFSLSARYREAFFRTFLSGTVLKKPNNVSAESLTSSVKAQSNYGISLATISNGGTV